MGFLLGSLRGLHNHVRGSRGAKRLLKRPVEHRPLDTGNRQGQPQDLRFTMALMSDKRDPSTSPADSSLSGDRPLTRPDDDRLGYAPFAANLTSGLTRMAPVGGFVVALFGPWCSWKTTVLNFVKFYLDRQDVDGTVAVVTFNPWWFSGHDELTTVFLEQLLAAIGSKHRRRMKKLRSTLSTFAEYVGEGPSLVGAGGRVAARVLRKDPADIHSLKDDVGRLLKQEASRIVVLIDDTDRLTYGEIRQLFRLIKAVADFPNITYVIALDEGVAREALSEDFGARATEYLSKIVQLAYELPIPERGPLRVLLLEKLDAVFADEEHDLDPAYWTEVFYDCVDPFIETPRDVSRLVNVLQATYPSVHGEVNVADYAANAALQTFERDIWDILRRNSTSFTGAPSAEATSWEKLQEGEASSFYDDVLQVCRDSASRTRADLALRRLF